MRTEGDFNAKLSLALRKMKPTTMSLKASDRFHAGIADFLVWHRGRTIALEAKFIAEWPSDRAKLLKHAFTPEQRNFMTELGFADISSYGVVAVGEAGRAFLIPHEHIISSGGNWTTEAFRAKITPETGFAFTHLELLVNTAFSDSSAWSRKEIY